jgi:hypothetical protein
MRLMLGLTLGVAALATTALPIGGRDGSVDTAHAAKKRSVPPCQAAFPDARRKTIGRTTWYNRQESVRMVLCYRFGLNPSADFPISSSMVCGVLAQVLGKGSVKLGLFVDGACSAADLADDPKQPTKYIGVACGWASNLLGVFVKPLGALGSAGCTLAPSTGRAFGAALESKHQFDVAVDVIRRDKCIKYSPTHFGSPWLADDCARGDKGFSTLPKRGSEPGSENWPSGGAGDPLVPGGGSWPSDPLPDEAGEVDCADTEPLANDITLAANYQIVATPTGPGGSPCGTVARYLSADGRRLFFYEPTEGGSRSFYEDFNAGESGSLQLPGRLGSAFSANGAYYGAGLQVINASDPSDTWTAPAPTNIVVDYPAVGIVAIDDSGEGVVYWAQGELIDPPSGERTFGTHLFYARRDASAPVRLSECIQPWTFDGSISSDGRYVTFLDSCMDAAVTHPMLYETDSGQRHQLSTGEIEYPYISGDGERILLVDFFGAARLVDRSGAEITEIDAPVYGVSHELRYLLTYSGDYSCPGSLDRYDVQAATAEPVLEVAEGDCALSRGSGFGVPQLLLADDGQTFVWNNARQASAGEVRRPQAYVVRRVSSLG